MRKNIILAGIAVVVAGIILEVLAFSGGPPYVEIQVWSHGAKYGMSPIIVLYLLGIALVLVGVAVIVVGSVLKQKTRK